MILLPSLCVHTARHNVAGLVVFESSFLVDMNWSKAGRKRGCWTRRCLPLPALVERHIFRSLVLPLQGSSLRLSSRRILAYVSFRNYSSRPSARATEDQVSFGSSEYQRTTRHEAGCGRRLSPVDKLEAQSTRPRTQVAGVGGVDEILQYPEECRIPFLSLFSWKEMHCLWIAVSAGKSETVKR